MDSNSFFGADHGGRVQLVYKPSVLKTLHVAEAREIKRLLNKTIKSGVAKYVVHVKPAKDGATGFTAHIRDENAKSIFDKRVIKGHDENGNPIFNNRVISGYDENGKPIFNKRTISGHNEKDALKKLGDVLKIEVNMEEAFNYRDTFQEETNIDCSLNIRYRGTGHKRRPEAVITLVQSFESEVTTSNFLLRWMRSEVKRFYEEEAILEMSKNGGVEEKEKESVGEIDEDDEEESKGKGSLEKANQGKKRDKVSSGQHS